VVAQHDWRCSDRGNDRGMIIERKEKKKPNTINFSLMPNVREIYKPYLFEEAKGRLEWEKTMVAEHESLMKNHTWDLTTLSLG
jgi:hypothetical protein